MKHHATNWGKFQNSGSKIIQALSLQTHQLLRVESPLVHHDVIQRALPGWVDFVSSMRSTEATCDYASYPLIEHVAMAQKVDYHRLSTHGACSGAMCEYRKRMPSTHCFLLTSHDFQTSRMGKPTTPWWFYMYKANLVGGFNHSEKY